MIFLTRENTIDEFNFQSNEKNTTKIKTDTIRKSFVTQPKLLKFSMKNILISQNLIH